MTIIPELGTPRQRVGMKPKGMAEFSACNFLASPQNIINRELTVYFPRQWALPLVFFNRTTYFLIEFIATLCLGYSEVYLQPFCQLIKSTGWKTNGCVLFFFLFCLSIPAHPSSSSELGFWWCWGLCWLLVWASETGFPQVPCAGFANFIWGLNTVVGGLAAFRALGGLERVQQPEVPVTQRAALDTGPDHGNTARGGTAPRGFPHLTAPARSSSPVSSWDLEMNLSNASLCITAVTPLCRSPSAQIQAETELEGRLGWLPARKGF